MVTDFGVPLHINARPRSHLLLDVFKRHRTTREDAHAALLINSETQQENVSAGIAQRTKTIVILLSYESRRRGTPTSSIPQAQADGLLIYHHRRLVVIEHYRLRKE